MNTREILRDWHSLSPVTVVWTGTAKDLLSRYIASVLCTVDACNLHILLDVLCG